MPIPHMDMQLQISGPEGRRRFNKASIGLERFAKDIDAAVSFREMNPLLRRVLNSFLKAVADAMIARHSTRWQPGQKLPTGDRSGKLAMRTGKSMAAVKDSVRTVNEGKRGVTGYIGGPFYLITHEEGKTISSRRPGGYMAIPLADAMDSRGVPLRPGPRSWDDTYVHPLAGGDGFIVLQRTSRGVKKLYVLKKTVEIPERLGMHETIKMGTTAMIEKLFNAMTIAIATKAVTGRSVNPRGFI